MCVCVCERVQAMHVHWGDMQAVPERAPVLPVVEQPHGDGLCGVSLQRGPQAGHLRTVRAGALEEAAVAPDHLLPGQPGGRGRRRGGQAERKPRAGHGEG